MFDALKAWYMKTFLPFEDPSHPLYAPDQSSDAAKKAAWIESYMYDMWTEEEYTYEEAEAAYEEYKAKEAKANEFNWF